MSLGSFNVPIPTNEPVSGFAPGSPERASLEARLDSMASEVIEIPVVINGEEHRTGNTIDALIPHDHGHVLAKAHQATPELIEAAIAGCEAARPAWAAMPWEERAAIFLKAADLLAGPWRDTVNAATMLGQSKTCHQAEIDSACELIDFFKFNVSYMAELYAEQPESNPGCWNRLEHRPLDGFVFAVTPFNFTSIAGNLPSAPAMLGNTSIWKPASTSLLSNWYLYKMFEAAGLPPGVINFVPGRGSQVGGAVFGSKHLGGVHFTGSTATFQHMWKTIGDNISNYGQYPRIVGETGGKDFVVAHSSAQVTELAVGLVRGAFEFQGQKCSAASRAYIPKSIWPAVRDEMGQMISDIKMGDVRDFSNFMGAVIDSSAFSDHKTCIDKAKEDPKCTIVFGGEYDDSKGYFVKPTVVEVSDPHHEMMKIEYFGPILSVYVYDDADYADVLKLVDETAEYALTGAIFATDRAAVIEATNALRFAAGNFYVNDKPTGAVVGQQPFGGSRASGTNDKAGSVLNLLRWVSPRTIKETFVPPSDWRYPFLG
ncbi:MAG: L-glutamate gamma-semialdehyde dehydrogenase [Planctomycetota bacterium]|jgi:1-pyrroline-5-carboxylate dehydrogenase